jgi:YidC/Oxa1 family membrane protein insertase
MYDRKTWIVLAICGILLAANIYYSGQNQIEQERARQAREALQKPLPPVPELGTTTPAELTVEPPPPPTEEELVVLQNDQIIYTFTNIGGGVKHAEFKNEFEVGSRDRRVRANRHGAGPIGAIAGIDGLLENVPYAYKADESIRNKQVVYIAKHPSGLIAKKTFRLNSGPEPGAPFLLDYELQIENATASLLNLSQWSIFMGEAAPTYQSEVAQQTGFFWHEDGSMHFEESTGFSGGMFSTAQPAMSSGSQDPVKFAGVTNQFFATVLRPLEPAVTKVWARPDQVMLATGAKSVISVRAGLHLPPVTLNPSEPRTFSYRIFIGPKHNTMLRKMDRHWGDGWGEVMQYGWFGLVSRTLNSVLNFYHGILDGITKNWSWGLAIILLTITVRIFIWPLHAKSTRTMKRMAKLQPEMAKLKEKYPDDPNKLNTEMMGLYRKFGINPLGGCLPMLIQIPIFFGFYRMLQYAVELRGQSFLWVSDLSQPDTLAHVAGIPINLLPIVMAITSYLQIKMVPMSGEKMQQTIMKLMPLMFFFFCYNFAAALALYWTTQNIFSIGQTWLMNKVPEPELKARPPTNKKTWVQRMAERQAEMQRQQKKGGNGPQGPMKDVTPDKKKRPPRTGG